MLTVRADKTLEAYSFVGFCIVFTPGLLRSMSNSKLMRFNIFMNFDREFSTHWQNKAPLFAALSWAPKICTHLGFLQPLPLWPAKWLNQSRGLEWGWRLCSLPSLSWQTSIWDEEMLCHSSRERNCSPPQYQGTPSFFCDRAVHTQLFYHVSVCILGGCVMLQGFNHLFSDRFALSYLFATCVPSQRSTTFSTKFFR